MLLWNESDSADVGLQFDALVVDEAQEFTPEQLDALLLLLSDPDESPVYLFADPFQHSARFSTARVNREETRGRYNWLPPEDMPLVALTDNVRNSEPIARTVSHFLVQQRSITRVGGAEPEILNCPRNQVTREGLQRVKKLLAEGFAANQVLVVAVGVGKSTVMRAAQKTSLDVVDVSDLVRWPLPPADLRVAVRAPDDVQGLEAEVVVVACRVDHRSCTPATELNGGRAAPPRVGRRHRCRSIAQGCGPAGRGFEARRSPSGNSCE